MGKIWEEGWTMGTDAFPLYHQVVSYHLSHYPLPPPHTHTHVQRINEKPQVVNDYESGRAIPNQQVISKLERAVGVRLRGKDMGTPLGPKKK